MHRVEIPWGAWRANKKFLLSFPKSWKITVASMADAKDLSRAEIKQAFANPIGQETIRRLAEGKKTASIAVDDLSRRPRPSGFCLSLWMSSKKEASAKTASKSSWPSAAIGR